MTGFTGVQWTARATERLAADLIRGAGVSPIVEAGLSWGDIAVEAAAIGDELRRTIDRLRQSWEAPVASSVVSQADALVSWLHELSEFAGLMARRLQGQAAATTVAVLAMPNPAEIAATAALRDSMAVVGGGIGGALLGAGAALDRAAGDQHQRAVRAMQAYETASTECVQPLSVALPPDRVVAQVRPGRSEGTGPTRTTDTQGAEASNPIVPVSLSTPGPRAAYAATTPAASVDAAPAVLRPTPLTSPAADPAIPIMPVATTGAGSIDRLSPPRAVAVTTGASAAPDADLAIWAESVAAPSRWAEVDVADPSTAALLRLPDPVERTTT